MENLTFFKALILGTIQGITEFLPVSSSAHLAITQNLMKVEVPLVFDVFLHLATLLCVLIIMRKQMIRLVLKLRQEVSLLKVLITATIITGISGIIFEPVVEASFTSKKIIGIALLINSLILLINHPSLVKIKIEKLRGVVIGLAQSLSLLPGISRSGSTITASKLVGFSADKAFEVSFFLYLPAVLGALIIEIAKTPQILSTTNLPVAVTGFSSAFITGLFALNILKKTVLQGKIWYFTIYCALLGSLILFL